MKIVKTLICPMFKFQLLQQSLMGALLMPFSLYGTKFSIERKK